MRKFRIPVKSFRRQDDPYGRLDRKKYRCYVHVKDVPDDIPMLTNPREQNLKTNVARAIEDSLISNDKNFHDYNRGLVISAKSVSYNSQTAMMTFLIEDEEAHGDIDGGHTYKIILQQKSNDIDQYVEFELMTGVEDIILALAAARNTSVQVDEKSLAELEGKFAPIKDSVGGMPFYNRIAFKQNQYKGQGLRIIDAREVVAILTMFNIDDYSSSNHPTIAFANKAKILEKYLDDQTPFEKMHNIAPDIFDLYNEIESDLPVAYNETGGRYGLKTFSGYKEGKAIVKVKFGDESLEYKVPDGIMYPLVAAFRALVEENSETGMYQWKNGKEPLDVYKELRNELASKVIKFAESLSNNPLSVGKDSNVWDLLYMTVELKG